MLYAMVVCSTSPLLRTEIVRLGALNPTLNRSVPRSIVSGYRAGSARAVEVTGGRVCVSQPLLHLDLDLDPRNGKCQSSAVDAARLQLHGDDLRSLGEQWAAALEPALRRALAASRTAICANNDDELSADGRGAAALDKLCC